MFPPVIAPSWQDHGGYHKNSQGFLDGFASLIKPSESLVLLARITVPPSRCYGLYQDATMHYTMATCWQISSFISQAASSLMPKFDFTCQGYVIVLNFDPICGEFHKQEIINSRHKCINEGCWFDLKATMHTIWYPRRKREHSPHTLLCP